MPTSDWAPAIGATAGAVIGSVGAVSLQWRRWRHERGARWDRDTFDAYASFLRRASSTFGCATIIAQSPEPPPEPLVEEFRTRYEKTEIAYEVLVLLDLTARADARNLLWILWNVGCPNSLHETVDIDLATRAYRDSRFHLRQNAQRRLSIYVHLEDRNRSSDCDVGVHGIELARPPVDSPWGSVGPE